MKDDPPPAEKTKRPSYLTEEDLHFDLNPFGEEGFFCFPKGSPPTPVKPIKNYVKTFIPLALEYERETGIRLSRAGGNHYRYVFLYWDAQKAFLSRHGIDIPKTVGVGIDGTLMKNIAYQLQAEGKHFDFGALLALREKSEPGLLEKVGIEIETLGAGETESKNVVHQGAGTTRITLEVGEKKKDISPNTSKRAQDPHRICFACQQIINAIELFTQNSARRPSATKIKNRVLKYTEKNAGIIPKSAPEKDLQEHETYSSTSIKGYLQILSKAGIIGNEDGYYII